MPINATSVLAELLSHNLGPDPLDPENRCPPNYGVGASLDKNILSVVLTFRRGATYCCMEWGCHMPLLNGKRWDRLREELAGHGVPLPPQLQLRLSCVVEEGAIFFDEERPDPIRRDWYAFKPVAAKHYQVSTKEAQRAPDA